MSALWKYSAKVAALKVGDPMDPATDIGPKVNAKELEHMKYLVKVSLERVLL